MASKDIKRLDSINNESHRVMVEVLQQAVTQ